MRMLPLILALSLSAPAAAHEIWVERAGEGVARIYLGEPDKPPLEGPDPEFRRLDDPLVFLDGPAAPLDPVRRADHLEVRLNGEGDVRLRDDGIFPPWKAGDAMAGVVYYARAGRTETDAELDLEIVPVSPGADRFTVMFHGQPLPGAEVRVLAPGRWQQMVTADANGRIDIPVLGGGRYILAVTHEADEKATLFDTPVEMVQHVSTLTFNR